ncbi:MAG TPA: hypothetical protein VN688_13505 [Gemmataceae bacterium]|nr:hypothetical protein [Gemmataceae bacterium]
MRFAGSLCLIILGLIVISFQAAGSPATVRSGSLDAAKPLIQEEFTGYGKTVKEAETDAITNSCQWLEEHAGLGWSPDAQYLRLHNMIRSEGEPTDEVFEHAGPMKVVKMKLTITTDQARAIQKQAQQQRMKSRQWLSLLGLGGLLCLLGVVGGYLRLQEATKGYCTRQLRIAAIGVIIVIVLGLCVIG